MREFKVGDKCVVEYTVTEIFEKDEYPIHCRDGNGKLRTFTREGIVYLNGRNTPILKHTEDITPKSEFPKWMMVSDNEKTWLEKYVIYKDAYTIITCCVHETTTKLGIMTWKYAKEIEPENNKLQELEEKYKELGQEIEKLKNKQ